MLFNILLSVFLFIQFSLPWWVLAGFMIAIALDWTARQYKLAELERAISNMERTVDRRSPPVLAEETEHERLVREKWEARHNAKQEGREEWESATNKLFKKRKRS